MTILVVCLGNINRSPLCAEVLRRSGVLGVASAGFRKPGQRATLKMRQAAAQLGLSLEAHRSRAITARMLEEATHVVYMDDSNLRLLRKVEGFAASKAICLGQHCVPPVSKIKDPNYMKRGSPEFMVVARQIVEASEKLAALLVSKGI